MRKMSMSALIALCALGVMTSCTKNDGESDDSKWKEVSGTYTGENLALTVNGTEALDKSVVVAAQSSSTAEMTLTGVVLGEESVTVNTVMSSADGTDYQFEGENSNNDRVISVEGTLVDGVLSLTVSNTIVSELVGNWQLKINEIPDSFEPTELVRSAEFYMALETPNDSLDLGIFKLQNEQVKTLFSSLVGPMIGKAIDYANIDFVADGTFGLAFRKTGEAQDFQLPPLGIQYYVQTEENSNHLYGAVPKLLMDMIPGLLEGKMTEEQIAALMAGVQSLLVDLNTHYALPMQFKFNTDGSVVVYASRDFILAAMDIIVPIISELPELADYQMLIPLVVNALKGTTELELGLVLERR